MKNAFIRPIVLALALAAAACGGDCSTTAPTTPRGSRLGAVRGETAESRRLDVFSFTVASAGNVSVTFASVSTTTTPGSSTNLPLGVGLGSPLATDCTLTSQTTTGPGLTPQLTGNNFSPAIYCVRVFDVGNLTVPVNICRSNYSYLMSARTEWIDLRADDGTSLRAFVAKPDGQATRGLLVFQEAFGVNAHIRNVTERFAAEGFLAISPELFHRTAPGFECGYSEFALATPHLQAITEQGLDADVRAAFGWLEREGVGGNSAAVGYCLGGRAAFVANSAVPLKAAAS